MKDQSAVAARFIRDEKQIKKDWLRLLVENPLAPLDVAYKAQLISVQREYHPYAIYNITCETSWSAKSIWEHQEERQIPVTKFQDYRGNIQDRNGTDIEVSNGNTYHRTRTPVTIFETETYTVTDNIQQTSGIVGPVNLTEKVWIGPVSTEALLRWTDNNSSKQLINIEEVSQKETIIPVSKNQDSAQYEALNSAEEKLAKRARQEVPGTKYEEFQITGFHAQSIEKTIAYLSVYRVSYEYEGVQYVCLMTGGDAQDDVLAEAQPVDETIKRKHETIDKELEEHGGCSQFASILVSWLIGGTGLGLLWGAFVNIGSAFSYGFNLGALLLGVVLLIVGGVCLGIGIKWLKSFFNERKLHREAKSTKEKMIADSSIIKQQVLELIYNDTVPEQQKPQMIQEWIEAFKASNLDNEN